MVSDLYLTSFDTFFYGFISYKHHLGVMKIIDSDFVISGIFHCVKSARIRSYSGPYFPALGLNTDQNKSEYGHFLPSVCFVRSGRLVKVSERCW